MPLTTPFHERLAPLNRTGIWKHWSGVLVAPSYQHSATAEYWSIRNAVSVLDTSPLFKYRICGPDAEQLLSLALVRDIRKSRPGRAQYTCWCDARGFVLQDGVVLRLDPDEFLLTAAEPALRHFRSIARERGLDAVEVTDETHHFGILALQGPHAHSVLSRLTAAATPLRYFGVTRASIDGCDVIVSRTGYTGDLGYELWVPSHGAHRVWDALFAAGADYNLTPIGTMALKMARIEAGLLLIGADFHNAAFRWVDAERDTPLELGWGWMLRGLDEDDRAFVGRPALEAAIRDDRPRWSAVGIAVDWHDYERVYTEAGVLPPRHDVYAETAMSIYRRGPHPWDYAGYASSFVTSPLMQTPLALARLPQELAEPGAEVDLEVTVLRRPETVLARVVELPFFNPPRKTTRFDEEAEA